MSDRLVFVASVTLVSWLVSAATFAQTPVQAPSFKPGDTWLFDETVEKGTTGFSEVRYNLRIQRVDSDSMVVGIRRDGAPTDYQDHVDGLDWSLRHLVEGREETTARPYNFPLIAGKTWSADYTDTVRHGLQSSGHYHWTYKVVGEEDVTTPAGTFHTVKVDADGVFEGHMDASAGLIGGGLASANEGTAVVRRQNSPAHTEYIRLHSVFDWSAKARVAVKTVEEGYDSQDTRIRVTTRTLVSETPAL